MKVPNISQDRIGGRGYGGLLSPPKSLEIHNFPFLSPLSYKREIPSRNPPPPPPPLPSRAPPLIRANGQRRMRKRKWTQIVIGKIGGGRKKWGQHRKSSPGNFLLGDRGGRRWNLDGRSSNFTSEEEEEEGGEELLIGGIQEFSFSGLSKIELPEIHLCKYDFRIFPLFLLSFFRWRERWRQLFQGINNDKGAKSRAYF